MLEVADCHGTNLQAWRESRVGAVSRGAMDCRSGQVGENIRSGWRRVYPFLEAGARSFPVLQIVAHM